MCACAPAGLALAELVFLAGGLAVAVGTAYLAVVRVLGLVVLIPAVLVARVVSGAVTARRQRQAVSRPALPRATPRAIEPAEEVDLAEYLAEPSDLFALVNRHR